MEEHFFTERGIYFKRNKLEPGRMTLVLIHGLSGSSSAWLPYEQSFENSYNLINIDLRAHGKSLKSRHYGDYELAAFADDVLALLAYLSVTECVLASHSFGSLVALQCILKHPEQFQASLFVSPAYGVEHTPLAHVSKLLLYIIVLLARITPLPLRKTGWHVDYRKYRHGGEWNLRRIVADVHNTTMRAYLYGLKHTYDSNYDELWKNIGIPTLIIHGEKDTYVPIQYALRMAEEIPNAKTLILPDGDHAILINDFSEVSTALESFLMSLEVRKKGNSTIY